jgi:molecular chaperone Hsp33
MEVSKILYGETKPYVTTVPATGHAERDWQTFYDVSEQVPTVVRVGQATESDELRCCGLTIQKMPDSAPHDRRYDLADLRFDSASFSPPSLADKDDLLEYLNELIPNADLKEDKCRRIPLDFYCRCSKKGFSERLAGLGEEQLDSIISDTGEKGIELTCHFCNELYRFSLGDLKAIVPTSPSSNL